MITKESCEITNPTSLKRGLFVFDLFQLSKIFFHILNPFREKLLLINNENPWPAFVGTQRKNKKKYHKKFSREQGELILALYFFQIFHRKQICLDLRPKYFHFENGKDFWRPSTLTHSFSDHFLKGLQNIYKGLFSGNYQLSKDGMHQTGLIPAYLNESEGNQIFCAFLTHFSEADKKPILFTLGYFFESFSTILKLFLKHRVKLPQEFAIFGCYLFSLYLCLRRCPHPLYVSSAFQKGFRNPN
jgi:hypothetical protein